MSYIVILSVYLVAEISFNIRLLDMIGDGGSAQEIERLERFGRLMSSLGFGFIISRMWYRKKAMKTLDYNDPNKFMLSIVFSISAMFFYVFQTSLINNHVKIQSAESLENAYTLMLVRHGMSLGAFNITHTDFITKNPDSPQTKAFITMLAPIIHMVLDDEEREDTFNQLHARRASYVEGAARKAHEQNARKVYEGYVKASNARSELADLFVRVDQEVRAKANEEAHAQFAKMHDEIRGNRLRVNQNGIVNSTRFYEAVNRQLRLNDIPELPIPFNVNDRNMFVNHVTRHAVTNNTIMRRMNGVLISNRQPHIFNGWQFNYFDIGKTTPHFVKALESAYPNIRPGMQRNSFLRSEYLSLSLLAQMIDDNPEVQDFFVNQYSRTPQIVPLGLNYEQFLEQTRSVFIANARGYLNEATRRGFDDPYFHQYYNALWIPSIALLLSMLMIIVNGTSLVLTIVNYRNRYLDRNKLSAKKRNIVLFVFTVLVWSTLIFRPGIGGSPEYRAYFQYAHKQHNSVLVNLIDFTIRFQAYWYPIGKPIERLTSFHRN